MHFDPATGVAVIPLDVAEGSRPKQIETPCGVIVSPVVPAQVIVRDRDLPPIVFDAVHGKLPDGSSVIGILNESGAWRDTAEELTVRIISDPYQKSDCHHVFDTEVVIWTGGCPICGDVTVEDLDAFDPPADEDEDDDDPADDWKKGPPDDDDEPPTYPLPRRFVYEDLVKPSCN